MLAKHIQLFLDSEAAILSSSTIASYRARLEVFASYIGGRTVSQLLCKNYLSHLLKSGRSRRTAAIYYSTAQSLFSWLLDAGEIAANPVGKLKRFAVPQVDRQPITEQEIQRLLEQARKDGRRDWYYMILAAWETGLRLGDTATLRWHEVNIVERVIRRMPIKTQRFGKVVEIPISEELIAAMKNCPPYAEGDQSFVCPGMAQKHAYDQHKTLSAEFIRLSQRAGVRKSFHLLRHAFVSRLLNKGVPVAVVQSFTGQSLRIISSYSHVTMDVKRAAVA